VNTFDLKVTSLKTGYHEAKEHLSISSTDTSHSSESLKAIPVNKKEGKGHEHRVPTPAMIL